MSPELQVRMWTFMLAGGSPRAWVSEAKSRALIPIDDFSHLALLKTWKERGWYDHGTKVDEGVLTARGALGAEWDPWPKAKERVKASKPEPIEVEEAA